MLEPQLTLPATAWTLILPPGPVITAPLAIPVTMPPFPMETLFPATTLMFPAAVSIAAPVASVTLPTPEMTPPLGAKLYPASSVNDQLFSSVIEEFKMMLPPASNVSWPVGFPVLRLKSHAVLSEMFPEASNRMLALIFLNALPTSTSTSGPESPIAVITPLVPAGWPDENVPSTMFCGSIENKPSLQPGCALASMLEFNDNMLGALTSTFPPFPPLAPPFAVI